MTSAYLSWKPTANAWLCDSTPRIEPFHWMSCRLYWRINWQPLKCRLRRRPKQQRRPTRRSCKGPPPVTVLNRSTGCWRSISLSKVLIPSGWPRRSASFTSNDRQDRAKPQKVFMNHCDPTERTAAVIETLRELVSFPSVSSSSNRSISDYVTRQLESLGFSVERTTYRDQHHTEKVNLVARRDPGSQREGPKTRERNLHGLAYFCHTDVVPANHWAGPGGDPFRPTIEDNRLYGRGSCDMKGSLAAMLVAVAGVDVQEQNAPLWIVCTADEETGFLGAKHIVRHSAAYRGLADSDPVAIIGEP